MIWYESAPIDVANALALSQHLTEIERNNLAGIQVSKEIGKQATASLRIQSGKDVSGINFTLTAEGWKRK